ncbi:MAG: helix-turn-helix transcriptional regulator [Clostridia bacterium]|nr:helix-turn-helix transcriptional regulator [Clostridia bacterium]
MTLLKQNEWLSINDMIFSIYKTSDLKKMRKHFLESLQLLVSYDSALFDFSVKSKNNYLFFDPISINIPIEYLKNYYEYYQHIDYTRWIHFQPNSVIYRDTDLLNNKQRESTEYFKEWMCPTNSYFAGGTTIVQDGHLLGTVTVFRSEEHKNLSEKDLFILNILNSHLSNRLFQVFPQGIKNSIVKTKESDDPIEEYHLTNREWEIIELVMDGFSNQEISDILFISATTVKKHLSNIFKKLNVNSRTQLIKVIHLND